MPFQDLQPPLVVLLEIFRELFLPAIHPLGLHGAQGFLHRQKEQIDEFGHGGLEMVEFYRGSDDALLGDIRQTQVRQV